MTPQFLEPCLTFINHKMQDAKHENAKEHNNYSIQKVNLSLYKKRYYLNQSLPHIVLTIFKASRSSLSQDFQYMTFPTQHVYCEIHE